MLAFRFELKKKSKKIRGIEKVDGGLEVRGKKNRILVLIKKNKLDGIGANAKFLEPHRPFLGGGGILDKLGGWGRSE